MLPRYALAVACVPSGRAADEFAIALRAAARYLSERGCTILGGHSVTDPEPKLGFAVIGEPNRTGRLLATGARPGDALLLTKPLGIGVLTSAYKLGLLEDEVMDVAVATMLAPSDFLPALVEGPLGEGIHAVTDVTGFGLLGHLKELCVRSGVGAALSLTNIPVLPQAREIAGQGVSTSAFESNAAYVSTECSPSLEAFPEGDQIILTDPQTSGGLLIGVSHERVHDVLSALPPELTAAAVIGRVSESSGIIRIDP